MPLKINEKQFEILKELNKKQHSKLFGLADVPDMTFEHPAYIKARDNFDQTSRWIHEYEDTHRKVDEQGKLTSEPSTHLPAATEVAPSPSTPGTQPGSSGAGDDAYFFEPSIPEVQTLLRKRPDAVMKLGLDKWITGIAEPEKAEAVTDPVSGMTVGQNRVPAKSWLDVLNKDQSAYKHASDFMWNERLEEAKRLGQNLKRYRDIPLKGHVPDFLKGGAIYNIERRLTPGVLGVADAATLGLASPVGDLLTEGIGKAAGAVGLDIGPQPTAEDVRNRSPFSYMVGNLYGYGLPRNPTNAIQQGLYDQGIKTASRFINPGVGTKAAVSALAGGGANAAEGAVSEFGRNIEQGEPVVEAAKNAASGVPLNSLFGTALGGASELAGQFAGAGRDAIRTQEHLMMPMKALREGGGDTSIVWGVKPSKEVRRHINTALEEGGVGSPAALAADEVAPHIQESLERQDAEAAKKNAAQMEEYYAHPGYRDIRVSSKPLVQALVDMVGEGRFHAPVSGAPTHMDPDAIRTIQNEVVKAKWAEPVYYDPKTAQEVASEVDGIVVDLDSAKDIFGNVPDDVAAGDVAVIVPKHMTAKELTRFEDKVYSKLKPNERGSTVESPVYKRLDSAAKEVRDQFPYYIDEQERLIPPPGGSSGAPSVSPRSAFPPRSRPPQENLADEVMDPEAQWRGSAGAQRQGPAQPSADEVGLDQLAGNGLVLGGRQVPDARSPESGAPSQRRSVDPLRQARWDDVRPSSAADTIERQSAGEVKVGSEDFLPSTEQVGSNDIKELIPSGEELGSDDFLTRSGVELGSADFQPPTEPSAVARPTPRLRDLRRRAVPQGPQKNEFDNHNDYLMARARWRLKEGKATAADRTRLKKSVDTIPPTERIPGSDETTLDTQRSIAPEIAPEDATPLSLLAGNKLAMPAKPHGGEQLLNKLSSPSFPASPDYQEFSRQLGFLADSPNVDGDVAREVEELAANFNLKPHEYKHVQDALYPGQTREFRGDPVREAMKGREQSPSAPGGDVVPFRKPKDYPDESLAGPMAKDWEDANQETNNWFEDIVSPGRDPRSDEARRMADLTNQRQAFDEAQGMVRNAEERLGPLEHEDRIKSIMGILSKKLGREVTKEDLIRAGLITGGAAAMLSTDDDDVGAAGAMAIAGGGSGFKKGRPRQLERKLDNGETVRGFSALRRQQHDLLTGVETAKRRVGASNEKTIKDRVMEYNLGDNIDFDRALLDEAKKLGLDKELRTAAATRVYPKLRRQAWGGSNKGSLEGLASFFGLRADKLFEILSGAPRNPFDRGSTSLISDNFREQLNLRGGRPGARYGDSLRRKVLKEEEEQ